MVLIPSKLPGEHAARRDNTITRYFCSAYGLIIHTTPQP